MDFVDVINIVVIAGNGGDGCVNLHKQSGRIPFLKKYSSSNGGDGGDVWLLADSNLNTLNYFRFNRIFKAGHGQSGYGRGCTGKKGKDIFLKVPYGTRVICQKTNRLLGNMGASNNKLLRVAKGGRHGLGNKHFKFSVHHKMHYNTHGEMGESRNLLLELLLIADVGIFGLPNSGKSSFVSVVSKAKPKVADYPFTTLAPCLGVVQINAHDRFVIADIPGIIKGAANGSGLGMTFLRHLEHCRILLHFVDIAPSDNSDPLDNIITIKRELISYNKKLISKPCWIVFTKVDLLTKCIVEKKIKYILNSLKWKGNCYAISSMCNINVSLLCDSVMSFILRQDSTYK